MAKLSRNIDPIQMNQAKQRSMAIVMDQIDQEPSHRSILRSLFKPVLIPTFLLIFALVVTFFPNNVLPDEPVVLNALESERVAEIAYISTSFIVLESANVSNFYQFLDTSDTTEFEQETEKINVYFDALRIFLEDDFLQDNVSITVLEEGDYDQLIEFTLNDNVYQLYMTIIDDVITGELLVGTKTFTVTGTFEHRDDEFSISLDAIHGSDSVSIEYESEINSETEIKYQIHSQINGVEESKEVKIAFENNERKVEIKEGNNEYLLKKEFEGNIFTYKLEYTINGIDGSAKIIEGTDSNGNTTYSYQIKEGNIEKEIDKQKPDYGYDDNPGNNDNPGNGDGKGNQSSPNRTDLSIKSI